MVAAMNPNTRVRQAANAVDRRAAPRPKRSKLAAIARVDADWLLFGLLICGLAWAPFPEGSNGLMAWGINALIFPGLVVAYEISLLVRNQRHPVSLKALWLPAALLSAVLVWIVVQNATWTPNAWHHPIWEMTGQALGKPVEGSISVNRDLTTLALIRLITSASVFWLAVQLCRNAARANWFVMAIAAIGCCYAAFGLISFALESGPVSWFGTAATRGFVTSTFVNHNNYATYAGIGLMANVGLILRHYRNEVGGGPIGLTVVSILEASSQKGAVLLSGAFVLLAALLLTGSRGGIAATALGLAVLAMLWFSTREATTAGSRQPRLLTIVVVIGAVVALTAALLMTFGETLLGRLGQTGMQDSSRWSVYTIALRSIWDSPLLGYGYGTFADVFPIFRDRSIGTWGAWEEAHNSYLEVLQGLGVLFGSMLIFSVCVLVWWCVEGALKRQQDAMICCVAVGAIVLVGVHAVVDFSLQIQAVTLTAMAMLGLGVAQSKSSRQELHD